MTYKDPEARKRYAREYYHRNKEAHNERVRKWQQDNPEKVREAGRKWRAENPEKQRRATRKSRGLPEPTRECPDVCECCGGTQNKALALDHCHETGEFRGWLCDGCNRGLGMIGDTLEAVKRVEQYLRRVELGNSN